ncbi:MAG: hypothetical protein CMK00_08400 [Planctomycetes bacterium]|nr:hypothetical protein [Planctomycetota bacterium]HJO26614.1 hypothetical protein [Planctomycetota bacterium]
MSPTRKSRSLAPEKIYDLLIGARTADRATLYFKDGRQITGAMIFNPFKGTGRLINIDSESSIDFQVDEIRDVKLLGPDMTKNPASFPGGQIPRK